jgi:hypothetical protein
VLLCGRVAAEPSFVRYLNASLSGSSICLRLSVCLVCVFMFAACAFRRDPCRRQARITLRRAAAESDTLPATGHARLVVVVRDAKTHAPVSRAHVWLDLRSSSVSGYTQTDGTWEYESQRSDSVRYRVRAIGYAGAMGVVGRRHGFADTLDVTLPESTCGLEICARSVPNPGCCRQCGRRIVIRITFCAAALQQNPVSLGALQHHSLDAMLCMASEAP